MGKKNKNNAQKNILLESNMKYFYIISKIKNKTSFITSYLKFKKGEIYVLKWMDIIDELIKGIDITDEELEYLNITLNKKLLNENYTVGTLLKEINIISDEKLSEYKKEEKLRLILREGKSSSYKYNYKNPKRTIPEDLKEYQDRQWVRHIIINPVGGKR